MAGTAIAITNGGPQPSGRRLEYKNDESRFGLTRAPFWRGVEVGAGQSYRSTLRRAVRKLSRPKSGTILFAAIIFDAEWQWLLCAAVAFVYGLAVMLTVIALLIKSAQKQYRAEQKRSADVEN